jgi:hypothetical protein
VEGRERSQLVPHLLGRLVRPVLSQAPGDLEEDLDVVPGPGRRLERLAHPLDAALGVGDGALRLAPRRAGGQDHVGHLGRLGHDDVLDDEVVEALEQFDGVAHVGLGLSRVLAQDV